MTTELKTPQDLDDEALKNVLCEMDISIDGKASGTMTVEFWPEVAPATVRNFLRYAAEGFYDGKGFHRVIEGFMIQGGCPLGTGTGSGPHGNIPGEFSGEKAYSHQRGVLSMARSQDPNSASCQFFICHAAAEFLDGQYAAFGKLVSGEEVLDQVATAPTKPGGEGSTPAGQLTIDAMRLRSRV
jgi:peptidyl-prolyl cis-trans isomerase B (cyclophilin B)